ncbi:D-alanyl-D-alanine carboxypeptidase family protein [Caloramator sp. ALD01]|uniref:D-alanyl-D-alanine carboxypeptidase family protein n=1 Tax=Caloramator sp. ALD01 TaxID=1031288 RepID=UPI000417299A|nr:D-alanyl-D-alanine carboxypeptidase family protein [Caloramator sp. ALD01]
MKRTSIFIITFIILISNILKANAGELKYELNCKSAVLIDAESGRVLFDKNKDEKRAIASLTKLMTYYTFIEGVGNEYKNNFIIYNIDNKKFNYDEPILNVNYGEKVKIDDLITAMLVFSANNAPEVLEQEFCRTKKEDFIYRMNENAKLLGLNNTHYINSSGLTKNNKYNVSTAYEQALLSYNILKKYYDILKYTSLKSFKYKNKIYFSTNKLLGNFKGVDGLKTGYTDEAGYCLVTTIDVTNSNGNGKPLRFISVVLGCDTKNDRFEDTKKILNYAINNYENFVVTNKDVFEIENKDFIGEKIKYSPRTDVVVLKKKNETVVINCQLNKNLKNNIKKGDNVGKITIKTSVGQVEVDAVATSDFNRKSIFYKIKEYIFYLLKELGWFGWIKLKTI